MNRPRFLVIIGSTRAQRIGPDIAQWVAGLGRAAVSAQFDVVDLRDWPLPMDDEPNMPAQGQYVQPHTQAWSDKVAAADGFVFVTPQYNWGYPAPLKNALDHLYAEWRGKPAAIMTYGGHGGGKCAAQLYQVLSGLKMRIVEEMPELTLADEQIHANNGMIDARSVFASQKALIVTALTRLRELAAPEATSANTE